MDIFQGHKDLDISFGAFPCMRCLEFIGFVGLGCLGFRV